jgi:hypothetical protein
MLQRSSSQCAGNGRMPGKAVFFVMSCR